MGRERGGDVLEARGRRTQKRGHEEKNRCSFISKKQKAVLHLSYCWNSSARKRCAAALDQIFCRRDATLGSSVSLSRHCVQLSFSSRESERVSRRQRGVMDTKRPKGTNVDTYQNLLLLGAIAAASAFVVTILIVLICVGCQR
ncbi:unnamed protein product [Tetraodon nigroviridis]|uniref:(spotted green pufferfish) hypothetical protein n=1 Tax=Tetraodon nigroviridis TaxID=99883 RepID=Q4SXQ8_TETNG|nr:unnamed protein product [Tetraodon nigroviridis]